MANQNNDEPQGNTLGERHYLLPKSTPEAIRPVNSIDPNEVRALIRYARDRGLGGEIVKQLVEKDVTDETIDKGVEIAYGKLCQVTYAAFGVTGRSVLDSAHLVPKINRRLYVVCILAFVIGSLLDGITSLIPETSLVLFTVAQMLQTLAPAFWGVVGAGVYYITTLSDIAERSQFDSRRMHGTWGRLMIGAIFGFVVVRFIATADAGSDPFSNEGGSFGGYGFELLGGVQLSIADAAIAFLAGLGAKAVYEIAQELINTIEVIARKLLRKLASTKYLAASGHSAKRHEHRTENDIHPTPPQPVSNSS